MKWRFLCLLSISAVCSAQEDAGFGAELPGPVDESHFEAIKTQSPFLRTLNFSDAWTLRGVAQIGEEPVAAVYNRESKKTVTVTATQANELGWKMVEVVPADELAGVSVKIDFGGEVAEVKYDQQALQPEPSPQSRGGGDGRGDDNGPRRGPTKEEIERWKSLSDAQKQKLGSYIQALRTKYPNASREEIGPMIRGAVSRMADGYDIEIPEVPEGARPPSSDRDRRGDRDGDRSRR